MSDPLKPYRKTPAPKPDDGWHSDPRHYEAVGSKDKVRTLDIRTASGLAHAVSYNYLLDVSYGWRKYQDILLMFGFMVVQIEGKNLRPVVDALKLRTAEFLQEWCDDFDPAADGEPVITSIKVTKDPRMAERRGG